jgi:hypothetical protein
MILRTSAFAVSSFASGPRTAYMQSVPILRLRASSKMFRAVWFTKLKPTMITSNDSSSTDRVSIANFAALPQPHERRH